MVLTDITTKLENYVSKGIEARDLMNDTIKKNSLTYKDPTELDKKAKDEFINTLSELYKGIENIPSELAEARKLVESALTKTIPENLKMMIDSFSQMNDLKDSDIHVLLVNSEKSYVGRRIVESKFNQPREVDKLYDEAIDSLNYFDDSIERFIIAPFKNNELPNLDNYQVRLLLHTETTNSYVEQINEFIDRFVAEN